jgi:hypothetical protein
VIGFGTEPRYGELIRRLIGEEDITPPGFAIEVDRPEWAVLKGEVPWFHVGRLGATAANFSSLHLKQPQTDRMTVVRKLYIINEAVAVQGFKIGLLTTSTVDAGVSTATSRDLRRLQAVTTIAPRTQVADLFPAIPPIFLAAQSSLLVDVDWMIFGGSPPSGAGGVVVVQSGAVNSVVNVYAFGYERRLRPEERGVD